MRKFFVLLVGGLALVAFASTAMASDIVCGTVGSAVGVAAFTGGVATNGTGGTATLTGGTATLTCLGADGAAGGVVPAGYNLTAISISDADDAEGPANLNTSQIQWTWTYQGGVLGSGVATVNQETAGILNFGSCTNVTPGNPAIGCDSLSTVFTLATSLAPGASLPNEAFTVTAASTGGDAGVNPGGNDSAGLDIEYIFTQIQSTPEPATFTLIGAGLLGLGLAVRKNRKA